MGAGIIHIDFAALHQIIIIRTKPFCSEFVRVLEVVYNVVREVVKMRETFDGKLPKHRSLWHCHFKGLDRTLRRYVFGLCHWHWTGLTQWCHPPAVVGLATPHCSTPSLLEPVVLAGPGSMLGRPTKAWRPPLCMDYYCLQQQPRVISDELKLISNIIIIFRPEIIH